MRFPSIKIIYIYSKHSIRYRTKSIPGNYARGVKRLKGIAREKNIREREIYKERDRDRVRDWQTYRHTEIEIEREESERLPHFVPRE